ncbi:MAG: hypothetical protein VX619_06040 [bacterium]|nr:hypothetical protein [bacterium]
MHSAEEDERHRYLLLRQMNYDFAINYEEHLEHASKNQFFESEVKSLQFKKRYNDYLLSLPTSESLFDPNGYFSQEDRLGYNPLKRQKVNDIYGASKYIEKSINKPEIFLEVDDKTPQRMNVNPDKTSSLPKSIGGFAESKLIEDSILSLDKDGLPVGSEQSIQARYQQGIISIDKGLSHISQDVSNTNDMIDAYYQLSKNKDHPEQLIVLHQKIFNSLDLIRLNSNSLRQYAVKLASSSTIGGLDSTEVESKLSDIQDVDNNLGNLENRITQLNEINNNPYTLIDQDEMDEIFDTKAITVDVPSATDDNKVTVNVTPKKLIDNTQIPKNNDGSSNLNPLGPPIGESQEDGTPPADLNIDNLPVEQADEIRNIPSWGEGARKRWQGVGKIILGGTMKLFTAGNMGAKQIEKGRTLLREADQIQREILKKYFQRKNKAQVE